MNGSAILFWAMLIGGLGAGYLFLHKDADVEQRIDKREAVFQRESGQIDKDFAQIRGDKDGVISAEKQIKEASAKEKEADKLKQAHAKNDQRPALREGIDEMLKTEETDTTKKGIKQ